jgi:transposase
VFNAPSKRCRKHADDLRTVGNAMRDIAQTGCQWRYLPESFGCWTRVEMTPSMVVVDTHLARRGSQRRRDVP